MRSKIVYCCEFCSKEDTSVKAIEEHEATQHYNISYFDFQVWKQLHITAVNAGRTVGVSNNAHTRLGFDIACGELANFEEIHGLAHKRAPSNWM